MFGKAKFKIFLFKADILECKINKNTTFAKKNMNNLIVNIGRQYGSGGHKIGELIAQELKIDFYDSKLVNLTAQASGICKDCLEAIDEKRRWFTSIFSNISPNTSTYSNINNPLSEESLFKVQSEVIKKLAAQKPCLFVGRCADYVLRDNQLCINIFCYASLDFKAKNLIQYQNMNSKEEAIKTMSKQDKLRASYYNHFTNKIWGDKSSYHLMIDTSVLGIEGTALYLTDFIKKVANTEHYKQI